jgi:hypothetical protein
MISIHLSVLVIPLISAAALDKPFGVALWIALVGAFLGPVVLAFGGLTRNKKLWNIGIKIVFVAVILGGIVMLYILCWFFLHLI